MKTVLKVASALQSSQYKNLLECWSFFPSTLFLFMLSLSVFFLSSFGVILRPFRVVKSNWYKVLTQFS